MIGVFEGMNENPGYFRRYLGVKNNTLERPNPPLTPIIPLSAVLDPPVKV